jgi:hypothetical protein
MSMLMRYATYFLFPQILRSSLYPGRNSSHQVALYYVCSMYNWVPSRKGGNAKNATGVDWCETPASELSAAVSAPLLRHSRLQATCQTLPFQWLSLPTKVHG